MLKQREEWTYAMLTDDKGIFVKSSRLSGPHPPFPCDGAIFLNIRVVY